MRRGGSGALAWASILGSYSLFRQMAHVSAPCEPRGASARGVPGARHACRGRESTTGAGGRAGGAHRCKCPKTKTSRRSCPGERHRAQTPSLRPGCSHRREPTRHGAGAAPFLHDEAGPLLAVLLHLHLLIVRHDPPVQTATTRDASVRRTASRVRSRSFCARARSCARGVCEDGTRPRLAGLPACAPCLAAHVASTLYVVRHACQLTVHSLPVLQVLRVGTATWGSGRDGRTAVGESSRSRGGEVCGSMPPAARALWRAHLSRAPERSSSAALPEGSYLRTAKSVLPASANPGVHLC